MPPQRAGGAAAGGDTSAFFAATLVLWAVSVGFEIGVRGRRELAPVAAGFAFFQAANAAVRAAVSRDPLFVNTAVSLLHSSLTSASVIFVLVNQWRNKGLENMFEHHELFGGSWIGAYSALCFSCGYFAYDQLDMLHYRLYSGWIPGILMHHLILLICFTLALYRNVTINYLILTLVCELHSIFLHIRKVRRMAGFRNFNRKVVKLEWALNWTTFVTARVLCHILITYKLITDAHKFDKGIELPLALLGMAGMNLLNIFLGLDLFKAYGRERNQQRHRD
ncbi:TLC domain-containing protein 2 [Panicum miliaceum]|uniref:TLC domain-containing protein 2 n=1 Tax=Panicum miliaceum TaxID=4540 RepID=A0A3L6SLK4_PANMI|nr:TLC domain-containing protein 2 [Panicum miliaceum]